MPVRRAKSCNNCRVAKARCSLSAPCSRCAKRRLECHYTRAQPRRPENRWTEGFRHIRPLADASVVVNAAGSVTPAAATEASSSIDVAPEETEILAWTATSTHSHMPFYSDFTPQFFDVPESFELSLAVTPTSHSSQTSGNISAYPSFADPLSPSCLLNFDLPVATQRFRALSSAEPPCRLYTFDDPGLLTTPDSTNFVSSTKALRQQFSQRTRSLQQGSLTARMLFSRLTDYTRMMADGKHLPPFIHPPCSLGRDDECPPDSPHRCLPETLAICANLTQMFYSRMPGSNGFVWQQIYTHIRQMRIDYEGYDEQRMLQAVQAAIVYGILCSQCTESVSSDDSTWLAATIETFGIRLYGMCAWSLDVDHVCFTRSKWILVESLRRIGCLLYLFDLLLQTDARTPSRGDCAGFIDMPLPCVRELWQSTSDRDWKKRYQEDVDARKQKGRRGLTLKSLLMLRQSSAYGENTTESGSTDFAEELAEWCEKVDDLSMLLWMALTVEDEGQAPNILRKYGGSR